MPSLTNRNYSKRTAVEPNRPPSENTESVVSSVVDSMINEDRKRKEEASLSRTERSLLKRERDRQNKRKANRAGYDIGEELKERVALVAKKQGITNSQLVAWILWGGIKELERSKEDILREYKKPSLSIHHDWNLDLEKRKNE